MRRYPCLLLCPFLLATAACAADSVSGPRAAPAPHSKLEDVWDRPPGAPDVILRGPRSIAPVRVPHQEPLYIVDGVVQDGAPVHLMGDDILEIQVVKGAAAIARFGDGADNGVIVITTRTAPVKALPGKGTP